MEAVYNPATGEVIAQVPLSTKEDVEQAVLAEIKRSNFGPKQLCQNVLVFYLNINNY